MTNPYFNRPASVAAGTTIRSDKYNSDLDTHESAFNALHDKLQHAVFLPETFSGNPNIPEQTVNDTFIYIDASGNIALYPIATILEQFELVEQRYNQINAWQAQVAEDALEAQNSATLSLQYANNDEDVQVASGLYSSKHWSKKAEAQIPIIEAAGQAKVDAAQAKVDEAQTKVTLAQNYANAAKNAQVESGFYSAKHYSLVAADQIPLVEAAGQAKVDAAEAQVTLATTQANNATTQANNAANSATKADNFANYAHNQLVPNSGGKYSAYHWSKEAEAYAQQTLSAVNGDFVPNTRTVNGKALSQNIVIGTADIQGLSTVATSGSYTDLLNIPPTSPPSAHTHTLSDITDAGTAAASDVTDFVSSNVRKSLLDSPLCRLFLPNKVVDTLAGALTSTRASTATYVDRYGVVKTAAVDELREEKEGWLIEGASTNLLTYSEQFDNAAWVKSRASITANNVTTAPDGTITADELTDNSELNYHAIFQFETVTAGQYYTHSCFVKANTLNQAGFQFSGVEFGNTESLFDLVSGTVIKSINCTSTIKNLGNGWFKISSSALCSTSGNAATGIILGKNGTAFYSGDGTSSIYIWGAQLEQLPFASSYIPTTTAPVTRAADIVEAQTLNNVPSSTSQQSIFVKSKTFNRLSAQAVWSIGNRTNDYRLYYASVSERLIADIDRNGTGGAVTDRNVSGVHADALVVFDADSGSSFYVDGALVDNFSPPPTRTNSDIFENPITFGAQGLSFPLYGHISDFRIYDFALNADEAQFLAGVK